MPRYKQGVVFSKSMVHPEIWRVVEKEKLLDLVFLEACGRMAIVTSCRDGIHMRESLHWWGRAVDLRSRDMTATERQKALTLMREKLGDDWDVILESDHYHLEYDPD